MGCRAGARRQAGPQHGSRTPRTSSGRAPAPARSSEAAAYSRPAAGSPLSLTASGDGDDRAGDLVVDGLLLRVPQLPQPADGPDDADREADFERPDQPAQGRFAQARELPGRHVADLEPERHHSDRLPAAAPEVGEVRDVDDQVDDARQAANVLQDRADDAVDDNEDDHVDEATDDAQAW